MKMLALILAGMISYPASMYAMKPCSGESNPIGPDFSASFADFSDQILGRIIACSNRKNVLRLVSRRFHQWASFLHWKSLLRQYAPITYISECDRERIYAQLIVENDVPLLQAIFETDSNIKRYRCNTNTSDNPIRKINNANMVPFDYAHTFKMRELLVSYGGTDITRENDQLTHHYAPLWNAIMQSDTQSVQHMLDTGRYDVQDLAYRNTHENTALEIAVLFGCYDIAQLILKAGYTFFRSDFSIMYAAGQRYTTHRALAALLLSVDYRRFLVFESPDYFQHFDGWTPLGCLIEEGDSDLIVTCVNAGADLEYWDGACDDDTDDECTPLKHAILKQNPVLVKILIDLGSNPIKRGDKSNKETPLGMAERLGNQEIIAMIRQAIDRKKGADLNLLS